MKNLTCLRGDSRWLGLQGASQQFWASGFRSQGIQAGGAERRVEVCPSPIPHPSFSLPSGCLGLWDIYHVDLLVQESGLSHRVTVGKGRRPRPGRLGLGCPRTLAREALASR